MNDFSQYMGFQSWDGRNNMINGTDKVVCRCNVCSVDPDAKGNHYDMIVDFIKEKYNYRKNIILASGINASDLKKSMDLRQSKGIGELFIWKHQNLYTPTVSNFGLLDMVREDPRPVYLHWDMNREDEWERLEKFLNEHTGPVILCHLGINPLFKNQRWCIGRFKKIQKEHPNLWGEISWGALDWLYKYPDYIDGMDTSRIFTASDLTTLSNRNKREMQMLGLAAKTHSTANIKRLFNIK